MEGAVEDLAAGSPIREGVSVLAASAAPAAIALATMSDDAGNSVTCLSLNGECMWRWTTPPGTNCLAIAWDPSRAGWVGVLHHYEHQAPDIVTRWSVDGELVSQHAIPRLATRELLPGGRLLVGSDGTIRDTRDNTVRWTLPTSTS